MAVSTRFVTIVIAVFGLIGSGWGTATATAETANGQPVPIGAKYRSCDYSKVEYVPATGFGGGTSTISSDGTTVTADVFLMIGSPNTPYQVRLIQGPRSSAQHCNPGDPGVAGAVLTTDGSGTGRVTVHAPRQSGATNAWVFVDGPPGPGKIRGDFYTSDLLTSLG